MDARRIYAEQKEDEVKILEHSVEELECTINVLEKKVRVDRHSSDVLYNVEMKDTNDGFSAFVFLILYSGRIRNQTFRKTGLPIKFELVVTIFLSACLSIFAFSVSHFNPFIFTTFSLVLGV